MYENHELVGEEKPWKINLKIIAELFSAERDEAGFRPRSDVHLRQLRRAGAGDDAPGHSLRVLETARLRSDEGWLPAARLQ